MVQIDGTDVKKKYLAICQDLQSLLELSVYENIIKPRTENLFSQIVKIKEEIKVKADTTDLLVMLQARLVAVKERDSKTIKALFSDLLKWLFQVFYRTSQKGDTVDQKAIINTAREVHGLQDIVEYEEGRLAGDREILDHTLTKKKEDFRNCLEKL
jgi:hypothetical protein